jgi:hypothetical protein
MAEQEEQQEHSIKADLSNLSQHCCGGTHTAKYHSCIKWKEVKVALSKQAPEHVCKSAAMGHTAAPKAQQAGPSAKQMDLGEGWNHVVQGGCCQGHHHSNLKS